MKKELLRNNFFHLQSCTYDIKSSRDFLSSRDPKSPLITNCQNEIYNIFRDTEKIKPTGLKLHEKMTKISGKYSSARKILTQSQTNFSRYRFSFVPFPSDVSLENVYFHNADLCFCAFSLSLQDSN